MQLNASSMLSAAPVSSYYKCFLQFFLRLPATHYLSASSTYKMTVLCDDPCVAFLFSTPSLLHSPDVKKEIAGFGKIGKHSASSAILLAGLRPLAIRYNNKDTRTLTGDCSNVSAILAGDESFPILLDVPISYITIPSQSKYYIVSLHLHRPARTH